MSRAIRDFVLTVLALAVLVGALVSVSPQLRARTAQWAADPEWHLLRGAVRTTAQAGLSVVHGYADEHVYLFTFLVAACVFVVLMLKVIR